MPRPAPTIVVPAHRVKVLRKARNWSATAIAEELGISRQTVHAIEAGQYVPNTAIALHLARLLSTTVEYLFGDGPPGSVGHRVRATLLPLGPTPAARGAVQAWQVGRHWLASALPRFSTYLPVVDRVAGKVSGRRVSVAVQDRDGSAPRVAIAGCDPALSVLAAALATRHIEALLLPVPSRTALHWLLEGHVHIAGTHLKDSVSGQYNLPLVAQMFGQEPMHVVTFAEWEEGLVVHRTNPKGIRSVADLARRRLTLVNRDAGSGARDVLDAHLATAGIPPSAVHGYDSVVGSHLAAAASVASGMADCCIATSAVAEWFDLDFLPLQTERFDLVMRQGALADSATQGVLDVLNDRTVRRRLSALAGYNTQLTGQTLRSA